MKLNIRKPQPTSFLSFLRRCLAVPLLSQANHSGRKRATAALSPCLSLLVFGMLTSAGFGQTLTTLHNFGAKPDDGEAPGSGVIVDQHGNVFGTTGAGGVAGGGFNGIVFEISPPPSGSTTWTETILHRFTGTPDGLNPQSRLVMASDGSLFGTTNRGGKNGLGTAYTVKLRKDNKVGTESVIYDFGSAAFDIVTPNLGFLLGPDPQKCHEDSNSCASLYLNTSDAKDEKQLPDSCEGGGGDDADTLFGSDQGGVNGTGAVYLLGPGTKGKSLVETILYNFKPFQSGDAAFPSGELVRDCKGNLFGVTAQGGVNNLGAVYEVSPPAHEGAAWTEKVIYSFNGTDGTIPAGPLLLGGLGQLFGTTISGGINGSGTVFELAPPSLAGHPWLHTIVYAFTGGADGGSPGNGVISDPKGRLFGTASDTIFMLTAPATAGSMWHETVLHTFTGPDGFTAITPLTLFNNALYGTTEQAGAFGGGTAFQLTLP
jgi:uncharacterized repeat protein (TIGR03803 family)